MKTALILATFTIFGTGVPDDEIGKYSRFVAGELEKLTFYNASKLPERYQKPYDFGVPLINVVDAINRVHVAVYQKVDIKPGVSAAEWRKTVFDVANEQMDRLSFKPSLALRHLLLAEASIAFVSSSAGTDGVFCVSRGSRSDKQLEDSSTIQEIKKNRQVNFIENHWELVYSLKGRQGARRTADNIVKMGRFDGGCWVRSSVLDYFLQGLRTGELRFWTCGEHGDNNGMSTGDLLWLPGPKDPKPPHFSHAWNWVLIGESSNGFIGQCDLTWSEDVAPLLKKKLYGKLYWDLGAISGWFPALTDTTTSERYPDMLPLNKIRTSGTLSDREAKSIRALNTHSSWDEWKAGAAYNNELYKRAKAQIDNLHRKLHRYHGL